MIMLLLTHVVFALVSMTVAGIAMFWPSAGKLRSAMVLAAGTLVSGTALVVVSSADIKQACITGLCYLAAVGAAIALGAYKLAHQDI